MADKSTELERVYTIPLRKTKDLVRSRRAQNAVRDVKRFLSRHMKSEQIWLDNGVNEAIWARGKFTIASRIRVRATRFSDGVVEVTLPETEVTGSVRTLIAERREKAASAPVLKAPAPEEGEETGPGSDRPVTDVKGIGAATAEKLDKAEIHSLAELAKADLAEVSEATGIPAERLHGYIQGAKDILAGKAEAADKGVQDEAKEVAKEAKEATKAPKGKDAESGAGKAEGDKPAGKA